MITAVLPSFVIDHQVLFESFGELLGFAFDFISDSYHFSKVNIGYSFYKILPKHQFEFSLFVDITSAVCLHF